MLDVSWQDAIVMSLVWLVIMVFYLKMHKKATWGIIDAIIDGKYNPKIMKFLKNFIVKNPKVMIQVVHSLLLEEGPKGAQLNEDGRQLIHMCIAEAQEHFQRIYQGKKGQIVRDGGVLQQVAAGKDPIDVMFGKYAGLAQEGMQLAGQLTKLIEEVQKVRKD